MGEEGEVHGESGADSESGVDGVNPVVDLLADEYAWTILSRTREEPKAVEALSDACDADPSTIYRRIDRLQDADLIDDHQQLDPGGHHYKVYSAQLSRVAIELDEDGFAVEVVREEEPADRFTRLYEGFK
ncbi:MAG: helix-turn-helix domain-containing protein [Haloferacaceae archaeon]